MGNASTPQRHGLANEGAHGRVQWLRAGIMTARADALRQGPRTCEVAECGTVLSRYNDSRRCFIHRSHKRDDVVVGPIAAALPEHITGAEHRDSVNGVRPRSRRIAMVILTTLDHRRTWMLDNATLCEIAGVSERSLQVAFKEMFGEPPSVYLRKRALGCVRRILEVRLPEATTVSEVAIDHGFAHLGRFSKYYRDLFGETPSETLRRNPSPMQPAMLIA